MIFYSFFKTLEGKVVVAELKNGVALKGMFFCLNERKKERVVARSKRRFSDSKTFIKQVHYNQWISFLILSCTISMLLIRSDILNFCLSKIVSLEDQSCDTFRCLRVT